jgi:hypothetical protein
VGPPENNLYGFTSSESNLPLRDFKAELEAEDKSSTVENSSKDDDDDSDSSRMRTKKSRSPIPPPDRPAASWGFGKSRNYQDDSDSDGGPGEQRRGSGGRVKHGKYCYIEITSKVRSNFDLTLKLDQS